MLLLALLDFGETWPRLRYVFVLSEFVGNVASIRGNSLPNSFRDPWELDLPKLTTCWSIHFSFDKALGAQPTSFVLSDDICLPRLEGDLLNLIYVFGNFGLQPKNDNDMELLYELIIKNGKILSICYFYILEGLCLKTW